MLLPLPPQPMELAIMTIAAARKIRRPQRPRQAAAPPDCRPATTEGDGNANCSPVQGRRKENIIGSRYGLVCIGAAISHNRK